MNWDEYFYEICLTVSRRSKCLSRKIGCVLVRDKMIIATGYNGPPRGIPHCGTQRFATDSRLRQAVEISLGIDNLPDDTPKTCPRKLMGIPSGRGLEWCYAAHAERNCLLSCARFGIRAEHTTLYMNCVLPCKECTIELIQAGVSEVVVDSLDLFHPEAKYLLDQSSITFRTFRIGGSDAKIW